MVRRDRYIWLCGDDDDDDGDDDDLNAVWRFGLSSSQTNTLSLM